MRCPLAVRVAVGVGVLLGLVSAGRAGTGRDDRDAGLYLQLGAKSAYASVGRLDFRIGTASYVGSGTLIDDDWVLTAAHCVDRAGSMSFSVNGRTYAAKQWVACPNWTGDLWAGYDLGLVQLSAPVKGVTPAVRYTGTQEAGKTGTAVGFGKTGTGLTGATTFDGRKRAGQNTIDALAAGLGRDARILLTDFDNPRARSDSLLGSTKPLNLEYMVAPGDSGGGLFLDSRTGPLLAGITSFTAAWDGAVNSDYGDLGGFTRVSAFNAWIDSILGGAAGGSAAPGSGTKTAGRPVPEPGTLALVAVGLAAAWRRRRP